MLHSVKDDYSRMVVGFVFDESFRSVLLVHKRKPSWQATYFNGIGGKCKELEPPRLAISRETFEEADLNIEPASWTHFLTLYTGGDVQVAPEGKHLLEAAPEVEIAFYFVGVEHCVLTAARAKTDEGLMIIPRRSLQDYKTVPNLQWIIPLAATWNEGLLPFRYAQPIEVFEVPKPS